MVRLNGEFEVSGCAPLTPSPTRSGESVEAVLRGGKQVVPFVIQSENHIASNPSINVAAHPMLSLFPGEGGRLTKPGESGAPLLSEGADGHKYLKGVISGVSMQQGVSLAEDVYRYQGFVSSHVGECVLKG